jgi:hypothetical protein
MKFTPEEIVRAVKPAVDKEASYHARRQHVREYEEDIIQGVELKIVEKIKSPSEPLDKKTKALEGLSLEDAAELMVNGHVIRRWTHNLARNYRHLGSRQSELLENVDRPVMPDQIAIEMRDVERGIRAILERSSLTKGEARMANVILTRAISDDENKPLSDRERKIWSRAKTKIVKLTKQGILSCLGMTLVILLHTALVPHQSVNKNVDRVSTAIDHQKAADVAHQINHQLVDDFKKVPPHQKTVRTEEITSS